MGIKVDFNGVSWSTADPFARALIEAAPDQCVWGSDWPHPYCITSKKNVLGPMLNDGDLFDKLMEWCDNDEGLWKKSWSTICPRLLRLPRHNALSNVCP